MKSAKSDQPPKSSPPSCIRIAVCCYAANAGTTSPAVEIAKAIRTRVMMSKKNDRMVFTTTGAGVTKEAKGVNEETSVIVDLKFFTHKSPPGSTTYEHLILDAGFALQHFDFVVDDDMWHALLSSERKGTGHFPPPYQDRASIHIQSILDAFREYKPNLVVRGVFPEVAAVTSILGIKTVEFGPIPMNRDWIMKHLVYPMNKPIPIKPQSQEPPKRSPLYLATVEGGWAPKDPDRMDESELREMMHPDLSLVCDLMSHYAGKGSNTSSSFTVCGPVFAHSTAEMPKDVELVLDKPGVPKVFLTMGSSGAKSFLLEAAKALCCNGSQFYAVIAAPENVCSLQDIENTVRSKDLPAGIVVTSAFLPSAQICSRVDIVLGHGGQGTVQTALSTGTPIVGVPMQFEQRFNLQNVVQRGAGICLEQEEFTADRIRRALEEVLNTPSYREAAKQAQAEMVQMGNGASNAAKLILDFAISHCM